MLADRLSARVVAYPEADHFFMNRWQDIAAEVGRFWHVHEGAETVS